MPADHGDYDAVKGREDWSAAPWNIALGVVSSLIATAIVVLVGPFIPSFDVDRQRFFTVLLVALIAYFTGAMSYYVLVRLRRSSNLWWMAPAVLTLFAVALLPAWVSVVIDGTPLLNWGLPTPRTPSAVVTERVTERRTEVRTEHVPQSSHSEEPTDPTDGIAETRDRLPLKFVGSWEGNVFQFDAAEEYAVDLDLRDGAVDRIVGTSNYPGLECEGRIRLVEVVSTTEILIREYITEGGGVLAGCSIEAEYSLKVVEQGAILFTQTERGETNIEGTLIRKSQ